MALRHLTDKDFQDYLDGNRTQDTQFIEMHLYACTDCQTTFKEYQKLYAGLNEDKGFELSSNFAASVMSKIPVEPAGEHRFHYGDFFLMILGFLIAVGAALYFTDSKSLLAAITQIRLPELKIDLAFITSVKSFFVALLNNLNLPVFAGLIISLFAVLDHFVLKPRYNVKI
jgi:hypothetical protein